MEGVHLITPQLLIIAQACDPFVGCLIPQVPFVLSAVLHFVKGLDLHALELHNHSIPI